jgi:hypothetical protein
MIYNVPVNGICSDCVCATDRSGKPEVQRLRETPGAEADEGRPRKPALPLAAARGLEAEGRVPPVWIVEDRMVGRQAP